MSLVSRRRIISIGVVAGIGAMLPADMRAALPRTTPRGRGGSIVPTVEGGLALSDLLELRCVSDSVGSATLNRIFPGVSSDPGFQRFLPLSFLATNLSHQDVRVFSTLWTITTATGRREFNVVYCNYPNLDRMDWYSVKPRRFNFTGRIPVIAASSTQLIAPFFSLAPKQYDENKKPNWAKLPLRGSKIALPESTTESLNVAVEVDAAITGDYVALGPAAASLGRFFCVTRNAEHDEAISLRNLIAAGASVDQIRERLSRDSEGVGFTVQSNSALYNLVRQRQAQVLQKRLQKRGWRAFVKTVEHLRNQPKTRLHAVLQRPEST